MINSVALMGRLTADPERRQTQSGLSVARFSIAIERAYSKDGERQTDFLDVVAWRSTADFIANHFGKGQMIALTGSIQSRTYTDRDGNKRKAVEIVASSVSFCGDGPRKNSPENIEKPVTHPEKAEPQYKQQSMENCEGAETADEDLPF